MKEFIYLYSFLIFFALHSADYKLDFQSILDTGDNLFAKGEYKSACKVYSYGVKGGADDERKVFFERLGNATFQMNNVCEAIMYYHQAVDLGSLAAAMKIFDICKSILIVNQDIEDIEKTLMKATEINVKEVIKPLLVRFYIQNCLFDRAKNIYFENVSDGGRIETLSHYYNVLLECGDAIKQHGDFSLSYSIYLHGSNSCSDDQLGIFLEKIGDLFVKMKKMKKALKYYYKAAVKCKSESAIYKIIDLSLLGIFSVDKEVIEKIKADVQAPAIDRIGELMIKLYIQNDQIQKAYKIHFDMGLKKGIAHEVLFSEFFTIVSKCADEISTRSEHFNLVESIYRHVLNICLPDHRSIFYEKLGDMKSKQMEVGMAAHYYYKAIKKDAAMGKENQSVVVKLLDCYKSGAVVDPDIIKMIEDEKGFDLKSIKSLMVHVYIQNNCFEQAKKLHFKTFATKKDLAEAVLAFILLHEKNKQIDEAIRLTQRMVYNKHIAQAKPLLINLYMQSGAYEQANDVLKTINSPILRKEVRLRYMCGQMANPISS